MNIEILSKSQQKDFIKEEMKKVEILLFQELNKMREIVLKLEEENKLMRRLLK